MEKITIDIIKSALSSISILSKIRVAIDLEKSSKDPFQKIFSWPNNRYNKVDNDFLLNSFGILPEHSYVESYWVHRSDYDNLKSEKLDCHEVIDMYRSVLMAHIVSRLPAAEVKITATWDHTVNMTFSPPTKTNDFENIIAFSSRKDAMYGFTFQDEKYKINAATGEVLFLVMGFFQNKTIEHANYTQLSGRRSDNNGRAQRLVVLRKNKKQAEKVMKKTIDSLDNIFKDDVIYITMKENYKKGWLAMVS